MDKQAPLLVHRRAVVAAECRRRSTGTFRRQAAAGSSWLPLVRARRGRRSRVDPFLANCPLRRRLLLVATLSTTGFSFVLSCRYRLTNDHSSEALNLIMDSSKSSENLALLNNGGNSHFVPATRASVGTTPPPPTARRGGRGEVVPGPNGYRGDLAMLPAINCARPPTKGGRLSRPARWTWRRCGRHNAAQSRHATQRKYQTSMSAVVIR
jgi:hypothetical protein